MQPPLVSVVVPTFNLARYLPRCIESVLGQTYRDWEMVVVDDASDDDTAEVVNRYPDRRIRLLRNLRNRGLPATLNRGYRSARGRYICDVDEDDWLSSTSLEARVEALERTGASMVHAGLIAHDVRAGTEKHFAPLPHDVPGALASFLGYRDAGSAFQKPEGVGLNAHTMMWRRAVLRTTGGRDTSWHPIDDYEFMLRMLATVSSTWIPDTVYHYGVLPGSMMRTAGATSHAERLFIDLEMTYAKRLSAASPA